MKKLVISYLAVLAIFPIAFGQDRSDIKAQIKEQRDELIKERQKQQPAKGADLTTAKAANLAVSAADVGEPDSFGKNVQFMGIAQSGIVILDPTCDPVDIGTLGPDDHCITVADSSVAVPTTVFNDVARITIPGKTASNIVYVISNNTVSFSMFNPGPNPTQARITYIPTLTIESEALNDPSLINPVTGLPFNGSFTSGIGGTYLTNKTLAVGASEFFTHSYSRANTAGLSKTFFQGLGLPDNVIKEIFKKPMTLRLNVTVSSRWVDSATLFLTARFLGN